MTSINYFLVLIVQNYVIQNNINNITINIQIIKSSGAVLEAISKQKIIQSTLELSPKYLTKESFVQIQ